MEHRPRLVALTGAGISKESGLNTFRDEDGLWYGHDVKAVASPDGFSRNPEMVLEFYNERRRQALVAKPNPGHLALADLESVFEVVVVTQNIDGLHEQAGSSKIIHLHGSIFEATSTQDRDLVFPWKGDLNVGDLGPDHAQLRPNVVWFGELVPLMEPATEFAKAADVILVIGTSLQVYPAASLATCNPNAVVVLVDPNPIMEEVRNVKVFAEPASTGVPKVATWLKEKFELN